MEVFCIPIEKMLKLNSPVAWSTCHLMVFNMPSGRALSSNHYPGGSLARPYRPPHVSYTQWGRSQEALNI